MELQVSYRDESLELMSISLAIYQRSHRPLEGLCSQLQCAGYDVHERFTETAFLTTIDDLDIDVILVDAAAQPSDSLLARLQADRELKNRPLMLIIESAPDQPTGVVPDVDVDDVVFLPIQRQQLRSRVRTLARLSSMKSELDHRRDVLRSFGIRQQEGTAPSSTMERIRVLLVGDIDGQHGRLINRLGDMAALVYAATPEQAWRELNQNSVETILLASDVVSNSVRQFCQRVRSTDELFDLPILILSNVDDPALFSRLYQDHDIDCISNPIEPTAVSMRLQMLAHQFRLRLQLRGMMSERHVASTIDHLTRLYSRGFFYEYLERTLQTCREQNALLSVITCKITGLPDVNALSGYAAGDRLIGQLGQALMKSCRAQDLVARIRGASFGVVLSDTSEMEAQRVCSRMKSILHRMIEQTGDYRFSHVELALGLAETNAQDDAEALIERALQQPVVMAVRAAS